MGDKSKKNTEKVSDSHKNFVSLQQENNKRNNYGTDNYRGAESSIAAHLPEEWGERLGLHSVAKRGRPSLGNRWDTFVYEEGLWSDEAGDQLGNEKPTIRQESDRLIFVAKEVGDYIPSTVWETFGSRVDMPSAESVVFTDEENGRVVKFKDPMVVSVFKEGSHLEALYQHHIHNRFFDNASYRFLGISKDPNNGGVRFVLEQPFIDTKIKPSSEEIHKWFEDRGFHKSEDDFFFTDGYVSFADVLSNDNCLKDKDGNLYFIDPMIKFDVSPKQAIEHYLARDKALTGKLVSAGIEVGTRFRIDHLGSSNDFQVKNIDLIREKITFTTLNPHQKDFEWSIDDMLDNIKLQKNSRWIQIDENRNDVVIPEARAAILERAKDSSPHAAFTDAQLSALSKYTSLFSDNSSKEEIFTGLIDSMKHELKSEGVPDGWVRDMRDEAVSLAHGEQRVAEHGLRR